MMSNSPVLSDEEWNKQLKYAYNIAERAAVTLRNPLFVDALYDAARDGLTDALKNFKPEKGVKFSSYASVRVKGAIYDYMRKQDSLPKSHRQMLKKILVEGNDCTTSSDISETIDKLDCKHALKVGMQQAVANSGKLIFLPLDRVTEESRAGDSGPWQIASKTDSPETIVLKSEVTAWLDKLICSLSPRTQAILIDYYVHEIKMSEIAEKHHLHRSRITQIIAEAQAKIGSDAITPHLGAALGVYPNKKQLGSAPGKTYGRTTNSHAEVKEPQR